MVLQYNQALLNELKIGPTFSSEVTSHGAGALGTLQLGAWRCIPASSTTRCASPTTSSGVWMDQVGSNAAWEGDLQFEAPYGATRRRRSTRSSPAATCTNIDVTPEMCARVAVENRRWALDHPHAAMRHKGPITVDDVLSSRMIASPLRLLDCAVWYPGGIATAMVLTRADIATRQPRGPLTYLAGFGQCSTHEWVGERMGGWGYAPIEDGAEPVPHRRGGRRAARPTRWRG